MEDSEIELEAATIYYNNLKIQLTNAVTVLSSSSTQEKTNVVQQEKMVVFEGKLREAQQKVDAAQAKLVTARVELVQARSDTAIAAKFNHTVYNQSPQPTDSLLCEALTNAHYHFYQAAKLTLDAVSGKSGSPPELKHRMQLIFDLLKAGPGDDGKSFMMLLKDCADAISPDTTYRMKDDLVSKLQTNSSVEKVMADFLAKFVADGEMTVSSAKAPSLNPALSCGMHMSGFYPDAIRVVIFLLQIAVFERTFAVLTSLSTTGNSKIRRMKQFANSKIVSTMSTKSSPCNNLWRIQMS